MDLFNHFQWRRLAGIMIAAFVFNVQPDVVSTALASSASDKAAAEVLFDEGVRLLRQGKVDEACPKLERSQEVDPGIGTLLYLGECYKQAGRTASAWATFREAASKAEAAGEKDRARAGAEHASALLPKLSRLLFSVDPANLQIEGFVIRQDKTAVNRALWGSAVPVDPGKLTVNASAPGHESFQLIVEVKEGPSEQEVIISALAKIPEAPAAVPVAAAPIAAAPTASENLEVAPEDIKRSLSTQRAFGLALGGTGLVGLGVGGVFGVLALAQEHQAQKSCTGSTCTAGGDGLDHTEKARTFATVSTVAFIAGGALLATGAILYYTAPVRTQTARVELTPTFGGAHLSFGSTF